MVRMQIAGYDFDSSGGSGAFGKRSDQGPDRFSERCGNDLPNRSFDPTLESVLRFDPGNELFTVAFVLDQFGIKDLGGFSEKEDECAATEFDGSEGAIQSPKLSVHLVDGRPDDEVVM